MKQYGVIPKFSKCLDKAFMQAVAHPFPRHVSLVLSNPKAPCLKKSEEKILFIFYGKGKIHMPLKNMTSSLSILAACEEVHNNNVLLLLMRKFMNFVKKYISKLYMYTYICRLTFVTNAF